MPRHLISDAHVGIESRNLHAVIPVLLLMSTREAVARRTRARTAAPAVTDDSEISTAGVRAQKPTHTQRFDVHPPGQKGSGDGTSAKQRRPGLWTDEEIVELKRLVGSNTDTHGKISWIEVEREWRDLNLSERSKASLSTKWSKINTSTLVTLDDQKTSQLTTASALSGITDATVAPDAPADSASPEGKNVFSQAPTPPAGVTDNTVAVEEIKHIFYMNLKRSRKIGCVPNRRKPPNRVSGRKIQPIINEVEGLIKTELDMENRGRPTWEKLSIVVYAGAMTVSELANRKFKEQINRSKEWFQNAHREVKSLHVTIGKATAELNRRKKCRNIRITPQQAINIQLLKRDHNVETFAEITSLVERLKVRLQLLRSRIALREEDERRIRIRRLPTKMVLRGTSQEPANKTPNVNQIRDYWKGIVGMEKTFNSKEEHVVSWEKSLAGEPREDDLKDRLTPELWQEIMQKAKPWKAHGPDGLQSFWWKAFKTASAALYQLARHHLTTGTSLPKDWLTVGRIVLIHKSGSHDDPANFRPIACLNTCYKLVTSFVTAYLHQYVTERRLLPEEQIALRKGVWGCTHALILDQTMIADALNQKQRPISVAWIDYSKAFDSLPHSYIKWLISALQVPKPLGQFIKKLLNSWKIRYEARDPRGKILRSNYLRIRSGVLQGDSLSPLLFCIAMAPISHAIKQMKCGYKTASGKSKNMQIELSHLFYMDDLKLYGGSPQNLTEMVKMVDRVSTAINMKMNTKKCAVANFVPKRMRVEGDDEADEGERCLGFPSLDSGGLYKYLGIEQTLGTKESAAWDRVEEKCCKTATQIWSSDLTFRQKVNTYNTTIIPALSYIVSNTIKGSGKFRSVLERGEKLDKKIRKLLVELKIRYKASCVDRLYLTTEQGGYGLKSVENSLEEATIYTWAYLCTKADLRNSLNLFVSMANRGKRSVISDAVYVMGLYDITADLEPNHSTVILNGTRFTDARQLARHVVEQMRLANATSRRMAWGAKVLAGRVLHSADNIDLRASFNWLREGKLSSIAVRNVIAAQEGCLITRSHPCCVSSSGNLNCRACGIATETIEHVLTGCSKWLPTLYIDRHDSVARCLHYRICIKYELAPQHYSQSVGPVKENDRVKLYWNQPVQTKTIIRHNKPDIVIFDKVAKTAIIIEFAVSWFTGIGRQIEIKRNRYCVNGNYEDELKVPYPNGDNLFRELQNSGWKVSFVVVVIGACGEISLGMNDQIRTCLGISQKEAEDCIERMERSAVLGSSRIIKNHLALAS
jgi:hypothetical protein